MIETKALEIIQHFTKRQAMRDGNLNELTVGEHLQPTDTGHQLQASVASILHDVNLVEEDFPLSTSDDDEFFERPMSTAELTRKAASNLNNLSIKHMPTRGQKIGPTAVGQKKKK